MIICAAIKDTRTGAVFGGIRHGDIYSAMHDAGITPPCFLIVHIFCNFFPVVINREPWN